jgi:hypothetical protein
MIADLLLFHLFIAEHTKTSPNELQIIDLQNNKITDFIQSINGKEYDIRNI